jgi:hypothetical protein
MELAGPDGCKCKCGIPQGPGRGVIGGRIFTETRSLGPLIIECPDKACYPRSRVPKTASEHRL